MGTGKLSVVGTPIGNLDDASTRMLACLEAADAVLCEDTRVTSKLLARYSLSVPLVRADENVLERRIPQVIERIERGERIAFVSDAGMPCVSDPGQRLVDAVLDAGGRVEVIPGPSAAVAALAASGLSSAHFFFEGFLPRKAGARERRLAELARIPATLIIFESPHRVAGCVAQMAEVMPGRRVALVRELTKVHEECIRDEVSALAVRLAEAGEVRGECVLVVEEPREADVLAGDEERSLDDRIKDGLSQGEAKSALARRLAKEFHQNRSEVYTRVLELS